MPTNNQSQPDSITGSTLAAGSITGLNMGNWTTQAEAAFLTARNTATQSYALRDGTVFTYTNTICPNETDFEEAAQAVRLALCNPIYSAIANPNNTYEVIKLNRKVNGEGVAETAFEYAYRVFNDAEEVLWSHTDHVDTLTFKRLISLVACVRIALSPTQFREFISHPSHASALIIRCKQKLRNNLPSRVYDELLVMMNAEVATHSEPDIQTWLATVYHAVALRLRSRASNGGFEDLFDEQLQQNITRSNFRYQNMIWFREAFERAQGLDAERNEPEPEPVDEFSDSGLSAGQTLSQAIERMRASRGFGGAELRFTSSGIGRSTRPAPIGDYIFDDNSLEEVDEMATVGQLFGRNPDPSSVTPHPLVNGVSRVGVELEVEDVPNPPNRMKFWSLHQDGSLRNNGIEFVFASPLGGMDAFKALSELDSLLYTTKPDLNIRCSTHVHVDVRDMTVKQLKRMILAYAYYESFLFRQSGYYRFKSNFCMPLAKAEGMVEILGRHWNHRNQDEFMRYAVGNWDKYCAMNLLPIGNYGSMEFRMAEAKSRKGQILRLVNRCLALKEIAMNTELDDVAFIQHLQSMDIRRMFRKGLQPNSMEVDESDFKTGSMIAHDIVNRGKFR